PAANGGSVPVRFPPTKVVSPICQPEYERVQHDGRSDHVHAHARNNPPGRLRASHDGESEKNVGQKTWPETRRASSPLFYPEKAIVRWHPEGNEATLFPA